MEYKGLILYPDGRIYEGEIHNNEANGWGRMIHTDYSYQLGNFVDGQYESEARKDAKGIRGRQERALTMEPTDYIIEEAIKPDHENGFVVWSMNDNEYKGYVVNGLPDGYGTFIWANGNRYDGEWKEGKEHGQGIMYYEIGAVYEGQFVEGERSGKGKFITPEGDTYKGVWAHDKMNGPITISGPGKQAITTIWKDDVLVNAEKRVK